MDSPDPLELLGTDPPTKEYTWSDPWPRAHMAEDGLVWASVRGAALEPEGV